MPKGLLGLSLSRINVSIYFELLNLIPTLTGARNWVNLKSLKVHRKPEAQLSLRQLVDRLIYLGNQFDQSVYLLRPFQPLSCQDLLSCETSCEGSFLWLTRTSASIRVSHGAQNDWKLWRLLRAKQLKFGTWPLTMWGLTAGNDTDQHGEAAFQWTWLDTIASKTRRDHNSS